MGNFPLAPRFSVKSVFCHSGIVVLVDLFFVGLEWARILIVLEASFDASASFVRVSLKSKLEDPEQYEVPFRLRRNVRIRAFLVGAWRGADVSISVGNLLGVESCNRMSCLAILDNCWKLFDA